MLLHINHLDKTRFEISNQFLPCIANIILGGIGVGTKYNIPFMKYFRIFPRPSPNELGEREEGWRLASREQPQPACDHGLELASLGLGNRNWPSQGRGTDMAACDEGAAPGRDMNWRAQEQGRGTAACDQGTVAARDSN